MTIQDIIRLIWNRKFWLIILTFSGTLVGLVIAVIQDNSASKVSTIVEMQWNGITSGVYPDQSRFDYSNLFEAYVYQEALESLDISDVSTRQLRNAITVKPIIEHSVLEMIENELRNGNQISYFATEYKITLNNGRLDLSVDEGTQLLNRLLELYKADFVNKYEQGTQISNYLLDDYDAYDYIQTLRLLQSQVEMIKSIVNANLVQGSSFTSVQLGLSFNDILIRTENLESIYLTHMQTRISTYLLTKDQELLLSHLRYQNEMLDLSLQNKTYLKNELENYVLNYPGSTMTIIVTGADSTPILIDTYLDTLYNRLIDAQESISGLQQEMNYNQMIIDRYEGVDPNFTLNVSAQNTQRALLEEDINFTHEELVALTEDLDIILKEYRAFRNRLLVRPLISPQYESSINFMLYIVIGTVIGGAVGLVTIFILENQSKKTPSSNSSQ